MHNIIDKMQNNLLIIFCNNSRYFPEHISNNFNKLWLYLFFKLIIFLLQLFLPVIIFCFKLFLLFVCLFLCSRITLIVAILFSLFKCSSRIFIGICYYLFSLKSCIFYYFLASALIFSSDAAA